MGSPADRSRGFDRACAHDHGKNHTGASGAPVLRAAAGSLSFLRRPPCLLAALVSTAMQASRLEKVVFRLLVHVKLELALEPWPVRGFFCALVLKIVFTLAFRASALGTDGSRFRKCFVKSFVQSFVVGLPPPPAEAEAEAGDEAGDEAEAEPRAAPPDEPRARLRVELRVGPRIGPVEPRVGPRNGPPLGPGRAAPGRAVPPPEPRATSAYESRAEPQAKP